MSPGAHRRWSTDLPRILTLERQSAVGRGTLGAHDSAICPELMRTTEISAAGQSACAVRLPWSGTCPHENPAYRPAHPPTVALTCAGTTSRHDGGTSGAHARLKALSRASRARPLASGTRWPSGAATRYVTDSGPRLAGSDRCREARNSTFAVMLRGLPRPGG